MFYWSFKKSIVLLTILIFFFCSFFNCKKDNSPLTNHSNEPDTTSHEFQWEYEIIESPYGGGLLYDVAISNENDIWAVGEIYADSAQPWLPYNAMHWDGQQWELKKINFYLCPNGTSPTPYPIQAIFAFSGDDIWFTRGASFVHWNGNQFVHDCSMNSIIDGSIRKIWGTSSQDLYAVGLNGTIIHFNGSSWQKLESGTTLDIWDIWGANNPDTGEEEILAVASNGPFLPLAKKILRIQDMMVTSLPDSGLSDVLSSIWFVPNWRYFVVGSGVFHNSQFGEVWTRDTSMPSLYTYAVRGSDWNNVFIVGAQGLVLHYNGENWRHYNKGEVPGFYGIYNAVAVKEDLVVAVGDINAENGIILTGRRKN